MTDKNYIDFDMRSSLEIESMAQFVHSLRMLGGNFRGERVMQYYYRIHLLS